MRDAFIQAITEQAKINKKIVLLTGDLGFKLFDDFAEQFPDRFYNMGVSEANMVSVAAGLALEGWRPFTYSIVPFATIRCLEQIRNDICNMNLAITVTGVGGGFAYGVNGPTHHGIDDIGALRLMSGMNVVSPCDPRETHQAVSAIMDSNRPTYLRLGRARESILPGTDAPFVLGEPKVVKTGKKLAFICSGSVLEEAIDASKQLANNDIDPLIISLHTPKPITGLSDILTKHNIEKIITIEEHVKCGGIFEAITSYLQEQQLMLPVKGLHCPDEFIHTAGSQKFLRNMTGLGAENIAKTALALTSK